MTPGSLSKFWQNATMGLILLSFVAANLNFPGAIRLWLEGATSIGLLLALGVGMKMTKDVFEAFISNKYK